MTGNTMSKAGQETAVGEGLAVGVLTLGVEAVTARKMSVESAFRRAWNTWAPRSRSRFPQIRADLARDSILQILYSSENRRGSFIAYWVSEQGAWVPVLRQDWQLAESADAIADSSGVPFEQWRELAETFLNGLNTDELRRG